MDAGVRRRRCVVARRRARAAATMTTTTTPVRRRRHGPGDGAGRPAQAELDQAQADLADANATIADQEKQISDLNAKVETGQAAAVDVQADLAAETERADQAESDLAELQAQVDAVAANFPVTVPASLEPYADSLVGAYTLHLTEAFCAALATCGQPRPDVRADIVQGPNGLELQIPNVFTTGLFMVEGSLFGVTDSDLIVPPCADGTPTNSQVSTTIFADGIIVAADGTETLDGPRRQRVRRRQPGGFVRCRQRLLLRHADAGLTLDDRPSWP